MFCLRSHILLRNPVLLLQLFQVLRTCGEVLLRRSCFCHLLGLVVEYDEIPVLEVEAVELITGSLRIHDIFVNDKRCAFGLLVDALPDLAARGQSETPSPFATYGGRSADGRGSELAYRMGPNLPNRSNSSSGVTL